MRLPLFLLPLFLSCALLPVVQAEGDIYFRSGGFRVDSPSRTLEVLSTLETTTTPEEVIFRVSICRYTGTICHVAGTQVQGKGMLRPEGTTTGYTFWRGQGSDGLTSPDPMLIHTAILDLPEETGKYQVHIVAFKDPSNLDDPWGDAELVGDIYVGPADKQVELHVQESLFPDSSLDTLEGKAAMELFYRGVIQGYADGTFRPEVLVNRAEAMKFLTLANMGEARSWPFAAIFSDVPDQQWYTPYILAAFHNGIVQGYADGSFRPEAPINTAEFVKMLSKTFYGSADRGNDELAVTRFLDVLPDHWYAPYVYHTEEFNPFPQRSMYLDAGRLMTRGDVAVALYQYWEFLHNR